VGSLVKALLTVALALLSIFSLAPSVAAAAQEEKKPAEAVPAAGTVASAQTDASASPTLPTNTPTLATNPIDVTADESRIVYVGDFDLDVASGETLASPTFGAGETGLPGGEASPAAEGASSDTPGKFPGSEARRGTSGKPTQPPEEQIEETPAQRARQFVDFVSNALVKELEKQGYVARRLRPGDARPEGGIRISGVFAEPDEQNRLRRAVIDGGPNVGPMALYVSIGNLARPDQALYAVVEPKTAGNDVGPVITVSAYAPVARFEMPKNITEKAVRDTATSIVTDLTQLLRLNIAALTN
jgi:hypothetical protein